MTRRIVAIGAFVFMALTSAFAADVAGKWTAQVPDGKINGDDVSFSLMRNIGGTEMTVVWKGKISGDEIKFTRTTQGGPGGAPTAIVAKRAK